MSELIERLRALARHEHSDVSIAEEAADALEARTGEVDGDTIAEVVAYLNGHKTVPAKRMAEAVLRLLNRHYQDAAALEAAREDACVERCKRQHPHTKLTLTRDIAPDTGWHWSVTLPGGHLYDVSHGRMTFEQARADLMNRGLTALDAADTAHRQAIDQARGKGEP